ncbi:protein kinase [Umezawaea sp. NPDC059074]|uniref:serine/threonine-protein kinase n=1 Tax=Umezawaea sp. NPDC059074 TaxID=3346716 RepID=UPI00369812C4
MEERQSIPSVPGVRDLRRIGRGGFATVYRGVQLQLEREVAVKVFDATARNGAARKQFESECKAVGRIQDVAVVQVYDSGLVPGTGQPFLVMQLCVDSLHDRVTASGPLPPAQVADIGYWMAMALQGVHGAGLLHRDVSPRNILFTPNGKPVLSDFGLAIRTDAPDQRQDNATWAYAAPETWRNEPSAASDVYGLGASLHFALTGRAAFAKRPGETDVAWQHRIQESTSPTTTVANASPEFTETVDRMMSRSAELRPQPSEVALRLAQHGAEAPQAPRRPDAGPDYSAPATGMRPGAGASPGAPAQPATDETRLRPGEGSAQAARRPVSKPLVAGVSALVLLVCAGAAVALWPSGRTATPPPSTSAGRPATADQMSISFDQPVDDGPTAQLSWRGSAGLTYAVIIAAEGSTDPKTVLVKQNTSYTAEIDPKLKYCFLVQGTDGEHTVESEPRNLRGGRCQALGGTTTPAG